MTHTNRLVYSCIVLLLASALASAQTERGKSELKTPSGSIAINYGRPSLGGRDMLAQLQVGNFWRLGKDEVTVLSTPLDLAFGSIKIPKGTHGLWLKRSAPDRFELVFNKQVTGHGMMHDSAKDIASITMTKSALPNRVETLAIDLLPAGNGGVLAVRWGQARLAANFQFAK